MSINRVFHKRGYASSVCWPGFQTARVAMNGKTKRIRETRIRGLEEAVALEVEG